MNDKVVWAGCALLMVQGALIGIAIGCKPEVGEAIFSAIETLGYLGGAATAVIAGIAVNSWRSQFKHTAKYQAMLELRAALTGLTAFPHHLNVIKNAQVSKIRNGGRLSPSWEAARGESDDAWKRAMERYSIAWASAKHFLDPDERIKGSPETLDKRFRTMELQLINHYPEVDGIGNFVLHARTFAKRASSIIGDTGDDIDRLIAKLIKL